MIRLVEGPAAHRLFEDAGFRRAWADLFDACPWATGFQRIEFVETWYRAYRDLYSPLLALGLDDAPRGILPLAVRGGRVVVAGDHEAEYQACISADGDRRFMTSVLRALSRRPGFRGLTLKYSPAAARPSVSGAPFAVSRAVRRPLLSLERSDGLLASLRKKKNKWRISALGRAGKVEFAALDRAGLGEHAAEIATLYDFRQAALHDVLPFGDNPCKLPFHLELARIPGLLHATVLRCGERVAAAHLGVASASAVHLGVFAHSALLAEFSPGKIHLLKLALLLHEQGTRCFDLTPGDDGWKDNFATHHDEVDVVTFHPSATGLAVHEAGEEARRIGKRVLAAVGLDPVRARDFVVRARRSRPGAQVRKLRSWTAHDAEMRIYRFPAEAARDIACDPLASRDELEHLLAFRPSETWQRRQAFLAGAMRRLEDGGAHVYTRCENGLLLHVGWRNDRQTDSFVSEVQQPFTYPPDSAVLFDYYTHPAARGRGLYTATLKQMLKDAAAIPGTRQIYISVLADNRPSRSVIEKVGFEYDCSLFLRRRFGKARTWSAVDARHGRAAPPSGVHDA